MWITPWVALTCVAVTSSPSSPLRVGKDLVGLDAEGVETATARIASELTEAGVAFSFLDAPLVNDCLDDPTCVASELGRAPAYIHVEVLRVGPFVQQMTKLYGPDGTLLDSYEASIDAASFPGDAPWFSVETLTLAGGLSPAVNTAQGSQTVDVIDVSPAQNAQPSADRAAMGYGGVGLAIAGGLLTLGSGALAMHEAGVLEDKTSLGEDKGRARVLGPIALGAALTGVLVVGAGGALSTVGFAE